MGGILAANIAALAQELGFPVPKAVMPVQELGFPVPKAVMTVQPGLTTPRKDLTKIPPDALLLTLVGDQDDKVGDKIAKEIFWGTPQIPLENKDFIIMVSERHGFSSITADHYAPTCISYIGYILPKFRKDCLDYYGFWKLFDALTDAAFYGKNREYALGNTPQQCYMGRWSDGTLRKELMVTKNP